MELFTTKSELFLPNSHQNSHTSRNKNGSLLGRLVSSLFSLILAPQVGLEPTTLRLTAECSAIELLRSDWRFHVLHQNIKPGPRRQTLANFRPFLVSTAPTAACSPLRLLLEVGWKERFVAF